MNGNLTYGRHGSGETVTRKATAEFTSDMVATLSDFFSAYADGGVVTVEVTSHGLWLVNPHTRGRQFLGLARLTDGQRHAH